MEHKIIIPDELEDVIQNEAVKLGLTTDQYLQAEADRRIKIIIKNFILDNSTLTEGESFELEIATARSKQLLLASKGGVK